MSDVVIQCEKLGKSYTIGHQGPMEQYTALRDVLARQARGLWNATRRALRGQMAVAGDQVEEFWALKDVSFEIKRGEVVGIIGRNGAGKSTLLKILSRITEPTEGRVTLRGRVASLLEVGTGFHPELTGRENIFLNGAILGMTRAEIKRKFDEIVAFAEVEKFLDTPVKRYSSGMYVRLAFAVAAHLEPEILVVDEVLAVGDAEFQKKCLGKMQDVSRDGRTVLFVSHNMAAIERLCQRVVYLDGGKVHGLYPDSRTGVLAYRECTTNRLSSRWSPNGKTLAAFNFRLIDFQVTNNGTCSNSEPVMVKVSAECDADDPAFNLGIGLYDEQDTLLFWSFIKDVPEIDWPRMSSGLHHFTVCIPTRLLNEGTYRIELLVAIQQREWILGPGANAPSIMFTIVGGLSNSPYWIAKRPGIFAPVLQWDVAREANRFMLSVPAC
jgi:lipopolysaccharide transport system ATP-binding protein